MQRKEAIERLPRSPYAIPMPDFLRFVGENRARLNPGPEMLSHHLKPENIKTWLEHVSKNADDFQSTYPEHWPSLKAVAREYAAQLQCIEWSTLMAAFRGFVPRVKAIIERCHRDMNALVVFLVPQFFPHKSNLLFTMIFCTLLQEEGGGGDDIFPDFIVKSLYGAHSLCQNPGQLSRRAIVFYVDDMIFSGQQLSQEIIDYTSFIQQPAHIVGAHQPNMDFYPITPFITSRGKLAIEDASIKSGTVHVAFLKEEMQHVKNFGEGLIEKGIIASVGAMAVICDEIEAGYATTDMTKKARGHLFGLFTMNGGMNRPPLIMEHKIADFKSINSKIMQRAMYIADDGALVFIALVEGTDADVPFYKTITWTDHENSVTDLKMIAPV